MTKCSLFYLLCTVILFTSCTKIGDYYTDLKDSDVEDILINSDSSRKYIGFGANIIGSDLNGIIFFKLIDTANYINYQIKKIKLCINNASDSVAEKKLLCIDAPQKIKYNQVDQIPDLKKKLHSGLPLQFVYTFNKNDINNRDKIKVSVIFLVNEDGKDTVIEKVIEMRKHTRYKYLSP